MLNVDTAGLNCVSVTSFTLDAVWTRSFVHKRVHRKPAVKRRTANKIAKLCEYCHNALRPTEPDMIFDDVRFVLRSEWMIVVS